jgi:hypothetical protein
MAADLRLTMPDDDLKSPRTTVQRICRAAYDR